MNKKNKQPIKCPKQLRWAIMHFAQSIKMVEDLAHAAPEEPLCAYHYKEYLDIMEGILVDQVATAFPSEEEMSAVLSSAGLDHLIEEAVTLAREWGREDI